MAEIAQQLRVFISSKQDEFAVERRDLEAIIRPLPALAPVLAENWDPQRLDVSNKYLSDVRACPIYVGLFGCGYSEPTIREYYAARENSYREILLYIRDCHSRDSRLTEFIDSIKYDHTIKFYQQWPQVRAEFERHMWNAVIGIANNYIRLAEVRQFRSGPGASPAQRAIAREREQLLALGLPGAASEESGANWAHQLREMARSAGVVA